ncbi:HepT-like ribonuclease domain-containing protein [Limnobacter sp.]|uniref:HepT-like ribonuclease domain-containing protein n=1 Tax=Limnobacter sp. TaxID=2003368 RepID=UPI002FE1704C
MTRDKQRIAVYLAHILEAVDRINRYTAEMTKSDFLDNLLVQDAVIRNFEIIGEASHNIEIHHPEFALAHPELPLALHIK